MKEGIFKLTYPEYNEIDAIRQSSLKDLSVSPFFYRFKQTNPSPSTGPMVFGNATHTYLLEPELFKKDCKVIKENRMTKAMAKATEENPYLTVISQAELEILKPMKDSFDNHPFVKDVMQGATVEQSVVWQDFTTDLWCKARQDIVQGDVVYDLKTTKSIEPRALAYSIRDYGYREQAAFYLDGLNAVSDLKRNNFYFIFIEKTEPFDIAIVAMTEGDLNYGRDINRRNLSRIKECQGSRNWPNKYELHGIQDAGFTYDI